MNKLPFEVNSLIFKQLDKKNLINCLYVNKSFAYFIYKILWKKISLKNVKLLSKIWFENEDDKSADFSNVVNPNLMFPYNEAVTIIECTYLNTVTFDMERIINVCKNVKCIIYQSSVIEKPLLKYQRPLYQWELSNIPKSKYSENQILLKKVDKRNGLITNDSNEWDDRTVTMEEDNNISSVNSDLNNYSSTENDEEMSMILNSIEQAFEINNEIIDISDNEEIFINNSDDNLEVEEVIVQDSEIVNIDTESLQTNCNTNSYSESSPNSTNSSCCWDKSIPFPVLSNLRVLDFSNSCISPEVLESFVINCSNLEEIVFLKNDISDKSLQQFMKCKTLKYLHINFEISSWDDEFTYEGFTQFVDFCCEKLHKLYIHSIKLLDKDMINYFVNHCPKNICSMTFDSPNITSQEISCFIKQSNNLNELVIGSRFSKCNIAKLPFDLNTLYPDNDLIPVNSSNHSRNLFDNINNGNNEASYSIDSINTLFKKSKNTEWLRRITRFEYHFQKMENGFIDSFIAIVKEMKNLEYLRLLGDVPFTNKNIFDLLFNLRNLKSLHLWIYNSEYNFNNFINDNMSKARNINNIILSDLKSKLSKMQFIQRSKCQSNNFIPNHNNKNENYNSYLNSIISSMYNDFQLIEMNTPFALTSECLELISCGVCPKLKEISGYFSTDVAPEQLENTIHNLSYINTIFISNFQFEQNNAINTITEDYQLKWKAFANKYKVVKPYNTSINHFNELNEILISSHRMVLTFNESFIHRIKNSIETQ